MIEKSVKHENVCAVCGAELPTESGRVICKECEEKANECESSER